MPRIVSIPLLMILLGAIELRAETENCASKLTRNCQIFKESKVLRIPVKDGTYLINPFAMNSLPTKGNFSDEERNLDTKVKIAQLLEKIPRERMSDRFKMALLMNPRSLRDAFLTDPVRSHFLPWPPHDPAGKSETLTPARIKTEKNPFTPEELQELKPYLPFTEVAWSEKDEFTILDDSLEITKKRLNEVQKLIDFARATIIDIVRDGRDEKTLSIPERAFIQKIRTIQYINPTDPSVVSNALCQGVAGNAFYDPASHSFTLCPNILNFPDGGLVTIIVHEFAHPIDPCISQDGLYKIVRSKIADSVSPPGTDENMAFEVDSVLSALASQSPSIERLANDYLDPLSGISIAQLLTDEGVLIRETRGINPSDYPFASAVKCLFTGHPAFYRMSEREIAEIIDQVIQNRKNAAQPDQNYDGVADREILEKLLKTKPECANQALGLPQSTMGEVMSDWIAAKALGTFLTKQKPQNEVEKVGSVALFATNACMALDKLPSSSSSAWKAVDSAATDATNLRAQSHPPVVRRLDLVLSEPNVRQALGCGPLEKDCFRLIPSASENSTSPAKATK